MAEIEGNHDGIVVKWKDGMCNILLERKKARS